MIRAFHLSIEEPIPDRVQFSKGRKKQQNNDLFLKYNNFTNDDIPLRNKPTIEREMRDVQQNIDAGNEGEVPDRRLLTLNELNTIITNWVMDNNAKRTLTANEDYM
ncbi:hypothetical protein [Paenibacillus naphthalenovorans]|uniref:hypothetical protein n=1 Tax=Paenibacillus naphthalenovorans TaxID=162209 RepID=UPI003D26B876